MNFKFSRLFHSKTFVWFEIQLEVDCEFSDVSTRKFTWLDWWENSDKSMNGIIVAGSVFFS